MKMLPRARLPIAILAALLAAFLVGRAPASGKQIVFAVHAADKQRAWLVPIVSPTLVVRQRGAGLAPGKVLHCTPRREFADRDITIRGMTVRGYITVLDCDNHVQLEFEAVIF